VTPVCGITTPCSPVDALRAAISDGTARLSAWSKSGAECVALCLMAVNLHALMNTAGPDLYRLAHLEAESWASGWRCRVACGIARAGSCRLRRRSSPILGCIRRVGDRLRHGAGFSAPPPAEAQPHPGLGIGKVRQFPHHKVRHPLWLWYASAVVDEITHHPEPT